MKKIPIYIQVLIISVLILIIDLITSGKSDGSLLPAIWFWSAIGQGIIAMSAAADLSQGKWIRDIKPYMQQYYPLLLLFPAAFLIFGLRHIGVYPWAPHTNGWLDGSLFLVRNVGALLLPFFFAHLYVGASGKESAKTGLFAVLYLFFFVVSQSFIGYDQMMSFEYPWINTLLGPFCFVEALYGAIAFCAILTGHLKAKDLAFKKSYTDFTVMIMGFALFWAGLFFSQYLVIWYGNIPEEVGYVFKRVNSPVLGTLGIVMLVLVFVVPFLSLVSRKVKSNASIVSLIAISVCIGLIIERLIYIIPDAHITTLGVALPMIVLGIPYILLMLNQRKQLEN